MDYDTIQYSTIQYSTCISTDLLDLPTLDVALLFLLLFHLHPAVRCYCCIVDRLGGVLLLRGGDPLQSPVRRGVLVGVDVLGAQLLQLRS